MTDTNQVDMKNNLRKFHLPFVNKMLLKVKNTEFEEKWKKLYNVITSDEV